MSFWDFSLENTGRTQIVSIQYQEQYGRAKKPVFMRVFAVSSVIPTQCWQRQIIKTIYAAEKAIWPTERQYVAGKISSTVHDIKALYRHLSDQMQQQIDGADRTVRDSERLFLREHVHTAALVQKASQSLAELSDSIQIYADMRRRNRNRVSVDDLEILAESFYVLATSWEEQLVWLERRGPHTQLTWCPKDTSTVINNLFFLLQ